jgi:hypothetical protein
MSRSTGWAASALVAVALAGCGGSGGLELLETYCEWEAAGSCARSVACKPEAPLGKAECVAAQRASCQPKLAVLERAVWYGRLAFDDDAAEACREVLEQGSCGESSSSCWDVFSPRVPAGGACDPEVDLPLGDGWLVVVQCQRGTCPAACGATCPPAAALGAPCAGAICEDGTYCSGDTGECTARLSAGESCLGHRYRCADGLYCAGPSGSPCASAPDGGCACKEPLPPGAACGASWNWDPPSACADGICWDGQCQLLGFTPGTLCLWNGDCQAGLVCLGSWTGELPRYCTQPGGPGQDCWSALGCQRFLACRTSGQCGAPLPAGSPCSPGDRYLTDCAPELACVAGSCAPRPPSSNEPPVPCDDARDCSFIEACDGGQCVSQGGPGASCRGEGWGIACTSGSCADDPPRYGTCLDLAACR